MCGICGAFHSSPHADNAALRARTATMNAAITHRGPDSAGAYHAPGVALAMRRLAIIDLNTGDQPIPNEDNTVWIVFNGEIFNFPALRTRLEAQGHVFRTQTDTEAIVHLYEEYGPDCVQHLNGQFAFAIWDTVKQRLLIARDRLGQKPLYYTLKNDVLYFSSELNSLLAGLPSRPPLNLPALDQYLSLQYVPEPHTPYQSVFKLPAAHRLVWERDNLRKERYWSLDFEPKWTGTEKELIEKLRAHLRRATHSRMISDVPLGAHLSGGIDSSVIVALMAEASSRTKTFSVGFEEDSFNELEYARAVVDRYATNHQEFILRFDNIPDTLTAILRHTGEPFADPSAIPLYHLSRLTRQHVTVALNGDGGDEAFAGYQRYWLDPWGDAYTRFPSWITQKAVPALLRPFGDTADKPIGASWVNGLKRLETLAHTDPRASILRWGSYFTPTQKAALWRPSFREQIDLYAAEQHQIDSYKHAAANTRLDRTLAVDLPTYLAGDLLVKADRMTMAHSLEGRSPFLDYELMEWAARLPVSMKIRGRTGKYLLRKAFAAELPPRIQQRGKQGFGIPVGAWFRGPLRAWARDLLLSDDSPLQTWFNPSALSSLLDEHQAGRQDHGKRLYALAALAVWKQNQA